MQPRFLLAVGQREVARSPLGSMDGQWPTRAFEEFADHGP